MYALPYIGKYFRQVVKVEMDRITIGIDIDGTINEAHKYDIIHGREFCEMHNLHPVEKLNNLSVKDMFGLDDQLYNEYMSKYFAWNVRCNHVKLSAAETIRKWSRDGHIIKIVTARDPNYQGTYSGLHMMYDTQRWLIRHRIPCNEILFGSTDKAKVCKENGIDVMIDDDPKHILSVAEVPGILAIIAGQSYNEYLIGTKSTVWCADWIEIRDVVHELTTMY